MKKLVLAVILFVTFLGFYGCTGEAKDVVQDGDFKIEFLFEKDGCRMYRFKDGGRFIYWAVSNNGNTRVQSDYSVNSGKSSRTRRINDY
jgi:hypothetical protein